MPNLQKILAQREQLRSQQGILALQRQAAKQIYQNETDAHLKQLKDEKQQQDYLKTRKDGMKKLEKQYAFDYTPYTIPDYQKPALSQSELNVFFKDAIAESLEELRQEGEQSGNTAPYEEVKKVIYSSRMEQPQNYLDSRNEMYTSTVDTLAQNGNSSYSRAENDLHRIIPQSYLYEGYTLVDPNGVRSEILEDQIKRSGIPKNDPAMLLDYAKKLKAPENGVQQPFFDPVHEAILPYLANKNVNGHTVTDTTDPDYVAIVNYYQRKAKDPEHFVPTEKEKKQLQEITSRAVDRMIKNDWLSGSSTHRLYELNQATDADLLTQASNDFTAIHLAEVLKKDPAVFGGLSSHQQDVLDQMAAKKPQLEARVAQLENTTTSQLDAPFFMTHSNPALNGKIEQRLNDKVKTCIEDLIRKLYPDQDDIEIDGSEDYDTVEAFCRTAPSDNEEQATARQKLREWNEVRRHVRELGVINADVRATAAERAALRQQLESHNENDTLGSDWVFTEDTSKLAANGAETSDIKKMRVETLFYSTALLMGNADLSDEEKQDRLNRIKNEYSLTMTPWMTPEEYQEKLGNILPGFRLITDEKEKAQRKALREKVLDTITLDFAKDPESKKLYPNYPPDFDRMSGDIIGVLPEEDRKRLIELSTQFPGLNLNPNWKAIQEKPEEQRTDREKAELEYRNMVFTAKKEVLRRKGEIDALIAAAEDPDPEKKEFLKRLPKTLPLLKASSIGSDYASAGDLTPDEEKELGDLQSTAPAVYSVINQHIDPHYEIYDSKPFTKLTSTELDKLTNDLDTLSESGGKTKNGDTIHQVVTYDLSTLKFATTQSHFYVAGKGDNELLQLTTPLLQDKAKTLHFYPKDLLHTWNFRDINGESVSSAIVMDKLRNGELIYAKNSNFDEITPLYLPKGKAFSPENVVKGSDAVWQYKETPGHKDVKRYLDPRPKTDHAPEKPAELSGMQKIADGFLSLFGSGSAAGKKYRADMKQYEEDLGVFNRWQNMNEKARQNTVALYKKGEKLHQDLDDGVVTDQITGLFRPSSESNYLVSSRKKYAQDHNLPDPYDPNPQSNVEAQLQPQNVIDQPQNIIPVQAGQKGDSTKNRALMDSLHQEAVRNNKLQNAQKVLDVVKDANKQGVTTLKAAISSQEHPDKAEKVADYVLALAKNKNGKALKDMANAFGNESDTVSTVYQCVDTVGRPKNPLNEGYNAYNAMQSPIIPKTTNTVTTEKGGATMNISGR